MFWGNWVFFSCWRPKKCQEILMVSQIYFIFCCNVFTTLIQCALHFCDVNEHFIYSHCIRRSHRKMFTSLWSHQTPQKESNYCTKFELHPRHFLVKPTKCLSPALKFFWEPVWCSNFHQSICMNVKNTKHTYL